MSWTLAFLLLLPTTSAFSLMKHDSSPLFTKSFQVHTLSSQNYDTMLKDSDIVWLVDYYAPWCPHCRHFAPEWERVANFYAKTDKVQVGAVDCTQNSEICNNENIHGYPGVKIHHVPADAEKAVMMARGARGSKSVVDWAERLMEEHGIKSGVNVEELAAQLKNFRNAGSLEMKYKRLYDAGIAAVSTFQNGFFMGSNVLEGERYDKNRHVLAMLVESMKTSNHWNHADWKILLKNWKEAASDKTFPANLFTSSEDKSYAFCKTYTCGLWSLLHSITVSDVKVSKKSATQPWKPSRTVAAIRLYVKNFFGCEECREHFMSSNPESIIKELAVSDEEGPHAVVMWIWKMHNKVNKALKKQQWPSKTACPVCYVENGEPISLDPVRLHEDEIVAYVTSAYGHDDEEIYAMDAAYNGTIVALWSSTQGFSAMMMVLGFFANMMRDHIA
ncbi:sulfhydryl oxidase, putative [Phytophthora infestans T30-4]|uniref:Sulfhydryl oxidase n=1 Tax=Phytophthora infestans (strain T30-4) TaxID=403677 RepID=D0P4E9_PHYIT|nr:sulfhydryl oxidase, putative [Phytophthora infestans T30-4]EEY65303.1 sulfhydryl oxidase, putative [Phytophthora infestans T30-4]|eukprot:XP_002894824.1 sulfhydryl oxidase, putative [Phytophthora infestans T30-4]